MDKELMIGDILYRDSGRRSNSEKNPIEHYEKFYITAKTNRSYIVSHFYPCDFGIKVDKKTMKARRDTNLKRFYPECQLEDAILTDSRFKIADKVRLCKNPDKLRKIKSILDEA